MSSLLSKPYRETGTGRSKLLSILAFGLFIFLFLFLFKPFGIYQLEPIKQLFWTMGFGIITSFVLLVFKFLIEPVVIGKDWTLGKNLLWVLLITLCIGASNYIYISIIFKLGFRLIYFFYAIWITILVGIIPVTINHILVYNRMYRNALKEADLPDEVLPWDEEVTITAGYTGNGFRVNPRQIIYLCSNDNYVTIVSMKDNMPAKITIRGTLKSAEHELRKNSHFIRCHKCYIVNLDFIEKVTGNNQNMKIRLNPSGTEIPVARSKTDLVIKRTPKTSRKQV